MRSPQHPQPPAEYPHYAVPVYVCQQCGEPWPCTANVADTNLAAHMLAAYFHEKYPPEFIASLDLKAYFARVVNAA